MYKKFLISLVLLVAINISFSQTSKVIRAEIETTENANPFHIANFEKNGLIITNKLNEFFDRKTLNFQFTYYNNILQKKWQKKIPLSEDYNFYGNQYANDSLMLILFKENKKSNEPNILLINFNIQNGGFVISEFATKEKNDLVSLKKFGEILFLIFENKNEDYLVKINIPNRSFEEIVLNTSKDKYTTEDFKIDSSGSYFYLLSKKQLSRKEYKFTIVKYNIDGSKVFTTDINNNDDNKQLLTANISSIEKEDLIITGSYNLTDEKFSNFPETYKFESAGMYFTRISKDGSSKTTFFNYLYFDNITKYLNKKEISRIRKNQEKNENKEQSLNYLVIEHDAKIDNNNILLISEAFYPEYRTVSDMSYDYYGRMTPTSRTVFDGYRYTNAFILCIDKNGTPKWNQLFDIWNILTMDLKERVSTLTIGNEMVMAYNNDGEVVYKVLNDSSTVTEIDKIKVESLYPNDKIMNNSSSNITHWYQNYFLAYGLQVIKNNALANKSKRVVFYLNKISFE